jgi:hypothetical protein
MLAKKGASNGLTVTAFMHFLKDYDAIDIFVTEFMAVRTFNNITASSSVSSLSITSTGLLLSFDGFIEALNSLATIKNPDPHLALHVRCDKFIHRIFAVHRDMVQKGVLQPSSSIDLMDSAAPTERRTPVATNRGGSIQRTSMQLLERYTIILGTHDD